MSTTGKFRISALLTAAATVFALGSAPAPVYASGGVAASNSFSTSFETGQPQPTWTSTVDSGAPKCSGVVQSDASGAAAGLATTVGSGPSTAYTAKPDVGFTGVKAFGYAGYQTGSGGASCKDKVFSADIHVTAQTQLSYEIFPQLMNQDLGAGIPDPSTYVAIDLAFSDGTYLNELGAVDQNGFGLTAQAQGAAGDLYPDQWNRVSADLGSVAAGKTVTRILVDYAHDGTSGPFQGWIDDLSLAPAPPSNYAHLADYVSTTRGTQSNGSYSRGSDVPATAVPHGFNFLTPETDAGSTSWVYNYSTDNTAQNLSELQALAIDHEPSTWINDRDVFQVMPGAGTSGAAPDMSRTGRELTFSHDQETAKPYYYGVTFTDGIRAEMTPTDHAAVMRFTFTGDTSNLVFDNMTDSGSVVLDPSGDSISGYSDSAGFFGAPGDGPMYFYATFSQPVTGSGMVASGGCANSACGGNDVTGYYQFDTSGSKVVTMQIATSYISLAQAQKNLALEIGSRGTFGSVEANALATWDKTLGVITVKGATLDQKISLYSSLYRLNMYPDEAYENTGTAADPVYQYASPTAPATGPSTATQTGLAIEPGYMYVNVGFWDTYRTEWPLDALLYPTLTGHMIQGFVNQYRDGGWLNRWSAPGYAGSTPGTDADVAIADAYLDGVRDFDVGEAYQAMKKDAMVVSPSGAVGQQGLAQAQFLGYSPTDAGTSSVDWSLDAGVDDSGISALAGALANSSGTSAAARAQYQADATFFGDEAQNFLQTYNPVVGFFEGRDAAGAWAQSASQYDPRVWGNEYMEGDGWTYSLYAPQNIAGLADVYGGQAGLADKLDQFFGTHETAQYGGSYGGANAIHEMVEAATNDEGEWDLSDEPGFGIPFLYDYTSEPYKAQSIVREALARDFTGSEIGQGYPGDEDNGALSSWYVFSALGLYPAAVGTGATQYAVSSPLYQSATIHLENGRSIQIDARNNSTSNVYVQSLDLDGHPTQSTTIPIAELEQGANLQFAMGPKPSNWGSAAGAAAGSAASNGVTQLQDVTGPGIGTATGSGGTDVSALFDNTSSTQVTFGSTTPTISYRFAAPEKISAYTLTSGSVAGDPAAWQLQGSNDGAKWTTLDMRTGQSFASRQQTDDYTVAHPQAFQDYRIVVTGNSGAATTTLSEVQLMVQQTTPAVSFVEPENAATSAGLTVDPGAPTTVTLGAQSLTGKAAQVKWTAQVPGGVGISATSGSFTLPADGTGKASVTLTAPQSDGGYPMTFQLTENGVTLSPVTVDLTVITPGDITPYFNNAGISDDSDQGAANLDGIGNSLSAEALVKAGITPGSAVTANGLGYTWPSAASGQPDNVVASGQTIALAGQAGDTSLGLLGTATYGPSQGTATITYTDGTTQQATVGFGDWTSANNLPAGASVAATLGYRNTSGGSSQINPTYLFTSTVALQSGKTVASITLPSQVSSGELHVFAISVG
ncbi:MAG TPA: GH92 family glycosyl hydrolase [Actinocrinis sp.]